MPFYFPEHYEVRCEKLHILLYISGHFYFLQCSDSFIYLFVTTATKALQSRSAAAMALYQSAPEMKASYRPGASLFRLVRPSSQLFTAYVQCKENKVDLRVEQTFSSLELLVRL